MTQLTQQNQIHYKPEVCTDNSEILISKKQKRSRFATFTQVFVLFSLISFAHTAMSIPFSQLLDWTNKVANETVAAVIQGKSLSYSDIKRMVDTHFPPGYYSISATEIAALKQHFANQLANAGVSASLITQLANWFESALDRFRGN